MNVVARFGFVDVTVKPTPEPFVPITGNAFSRIVVKSERMKSSLAVRNSQASATSLFAMPRSGSAASILAQPSFIAENRG